MACKTQKPSNMSEQEKTKEKKSEKNLCTCKSRKNIVNHTRKRMREEATHMYTHKAKKSMF